MRLNADDNDNSEGRDANELKQRRAHAYAGLQCLGCDTRTPDKEKMRAPKIVTRRGQDGSNPALRQNEIYDGGIRYGYSLETELTAISLKLPDTLILTSGECARALHLTRAEYIRRAIERMNYETRRGFRAKRLADVSQRERTASMRVNAEFTAIEEDPDGQSG